MALAVVDVTDEVGPDEETPIPGLAVTEASNGYGLPIVVAANGYGIPVIYVEAGGLPVVTES